jgi:hypothetical protein
MAARIWTIKSRNLKFLGYKIKQENNCCAVSCETDVTTAD